MRSRAVVASWILVATTTLMPSLALATETPGTIGIVKVYGNVIYFSLTSGAPLCGTAPTGSSAWGNITLNSQGITPEAFRNLLSTIMAAKLAGKSVTIGAATDSSGSGWGCWVQFVQLN